MTWDEVLQHVRADLAARASVATQRAAEIGPAIDAYVRAREVELAIEFAARNGLPNAPEPLDVLAAALRLSGLVAALPELTATATDLAPAWAAPKSEPTPARFETMDIPTLEQAQRTLAAEFDAAPFASMRLDEFMLYAAEFAATARALQERTGGDPLSQRVIRRLTAMVHERELLKKVFGLSRAHTADWQRLANETRARRLAAMAGGDPRVA